MENTEVEFDTSERSPEAQAIIDAELGIEREVSEEEDDELGLPSDEGSEEEEVKLAGKYSSTEELVKGIKNIGSNLPEYVLDGMSDTALEQHYRELEKNIPTEKRGRKHSDKKEEVVENKEGSSDRPEAISAELWTELDSTFAETGSITDEQYNKLNAAGIPDTMIDRYLDGIKAEATMKQQEFTQGVYKIAGGEEQYHEIKSWAEDGGVSQARLAEISAMKDYKDITLAMYEIKMAYDTSGNKSNTIRGTKSTAGGTRGYKSEQEYLADVNDIRYKTNEAFRNKVKSKLSKSNLTEA